MALNNRFFEYIIDHSWGRFDPVQDLYFLMPAAFDTGGQIQMGYDAFGDGQNDGYFTTADLAKVYTYLVSMKDGTNLTLGGAAASDYSEYSLFYSGVNTQKTGGAILFVGNGTIDFANTTGQGKLGSVGEEPDPAEIQKIESISICTTNMLDIGNKTIGKAQIVHTTQTVESHSIKAVGKLTVKGDMSASIESYVYDTMFGSYTLVDGTSSTTYNTASNNTATVAAYRTASMEIAKGFNGSLCSEVYGIKVRPKTTAVANANKIGSYGYWSDGNFTINGLWSTTGKTVNSVLGLWDGMIVAYTGQVSIGDIIDPRAGEEAEALDWKDGAPVGSVSASAVNNSVVAYGIKAGAIVLQDVGKWVMAADGSYEWLDGGVISTLVEDVGIWASSWDKDGKNTAAISGNKIISAAISGTSLTVNGYFAPTLSSTINNFSMTANSSQTITITGNEVAIYGIELTGALTAKNNFGGTISVTFTNDNPVVNPNTTPGKNGRTVGASNMLADIGISGIKAATIKIDGIMDTTISVTVSRMAAPDGYAMISGMSFATFTAVALSSNITVVGSVRTSDLLGNRDYCGLYIGTVGLAVGTYLLNSNAANADDKVFNITGNINVSNGTINVGIGGGYGDGINGSNKNGYNLRVSGTIYAADSPWVEYLKRWGVEKVDLPAYAILAGSMTPSAVFNQTDLSKSSVSITVKNTAKNDRVEIAAGAYIRGNIELGNGDNALIIDSNATVKGDLTALGAAGTLNVEIVLNNNPFEGVAITSGTPIISALTEATFASTSGMTLNLNMAAATDYIIYEGQRADMIDWQDRIINFKYQGLNKSEFERLGLRISDSSNGSCLAAEKGITGKFSATGGVLEIVDANNNLYLKLRGEIVGKQVVVHVDKLPDTPVVPLKELSDFTTSFNQKTRTVTLGWNDNDGTTVESYEVEYRIKTLNGAGTVTNVGKTIVQTLKGKIGKSTYTIKNVDQNQIIEWRVRQTLGGNDTVSQWSAFQTTKNGSFDRKELTLDKVTNATFELGKAAANPSSLLTWEASKSSEGVKCYEVRYYQTTVHYSAPLQRAVGQSEVHDQAGLEQSDSADRPPEHRVLLLAGAGR